MAKSQGRVSDMGTKRIGLARIEALLENLERDLNLADSTLTNCTITTNQVATFTGGVTSNYLDFLSGNTANLTGTVVALTDAEIDLAGATANAANILAVTLGLNAVNTFAGLGDAVGSVYLPVATRDAHLAMHITSELDAANAITFFTRGALGAGTDVVFSTQVIQPANGYASVQSLLTTGTATTPTAIKLIYTPAAAATNFLGPGSMMHFYAPADDRWLVRIYNVPKGSGATGVLTQATS